MFLAVTMPPSDRDTPLGVKCFALVNSHGQSQIQLKYAINKYFGLTESNILYYILVFYYINNN
jgi:hypothetical protein